MWKVRITLIINPYVIFKKYMHFSGHESLKNYREMHINSCITHHIFMSYACSSFWCYLCAFECFKLLLFGRYFYPKSNSGYFMRICVLWELNPWPWRFKRLALPEAVFIFYKMKSNHSNFYSAQYKNVNAFLFSSAEQSEIT